MQGRLEGRAWRITKLRNEVAFLYSDEAQGGSNHTTEIAVLNQQIEAIQAEGKDGTAE